MVGNRLFSYINDANGQIMVRDEITGAKDRVTYRTKAYQDPGSVASKVTRYYYVNGKRVGDISNDGPSRTDYAQALANRGAPQGNNAGWQPIGSADFDQNYEPISPIYPGAVATTYLVKNGDTLQSIASSVWGDSAMWYLIADANGLASGSSLVAGQVLTIPNKVANINNNAGTLRPYNPGEAIGDTSPTLPVAPSPPKKKRKCGGFLAIIVAVIAVVATNYTAGALAPAAAGLGGSTFAAGTAVLGGTAAGLSAGAAFGVAALAGAVGSVAGQLAGLALGVQDKFNWGAVAAGAIGAGIGASGALGSIAGQGNYIGQAIAGNIINQGVGIITGAQKGFSWAGVAAAAIAAPITSKIGESIKGNTSFGGATPAGAVLRGAVAGVATSTVNELTRVALVGGKLNWSSVAIGGIQGGIYGYGEGLGNQARADAVRQANAQTDAAYNRLTSLRPDGKSPWGESYNVASTGGGVAMSKENPNEELPVMNGVESLYYQESENYAKRFATGAYGAVKGAITEPFLQAYDLGVAATSFIYNESAEAINGKNPLWFPQTYSGVSKAYENGASGLRLFAQSNPVSGVGVMSYDMTTSALNGQWGDFTEQLGGLTGGFAVGKAASRNWTKTVDGQVGTVKLTNGLNEIDFTRKINRLNSAATREGGLFPTEVIATAAERSALTRAYRQEAIERINSLYKNNPEAKQNALAKLRNSDIDHIRDLQLGGENVRSNLKSLDRSVNRSLGKQLQLNNLDKNIPVIRIEIDYLK